MVPNQMSPFTVPPPTHTHTHICCDFLLLTIPGELNQDGTGQGEHRPLGQVSAGARRETGPTEPVLLQAPLQRGRCVAPGSGKEEGRKGWERREAPPGNSNISLPQPNRQLEGDRRC